MPTVRAGESGSTNMPASTVEKQHNPLIGAWGLQLQTRPHSVTSRRLIPGMDNAHISKSQRLKSILGMSSTPTLWFNVEVGVPTLVPVEHKSIPFTVRMMPKWSITSEIIQHVPQVVKPISVKFILNSELSLPSGYQSLKYANWWEVQELQSDDSQVKHIAIQIPHSSNNSATDIGTAINLQINHSLNRNGTFKDFCALHARRKHEISWVLKCEVAGETFDVQGAQGVRVILANSDSLEPGNPTQPDEFGILDLDFSEPGDADFLGFDDI